MNELDIELPTIDRPIKFKTLKDGTNICTCRLPKIKKFALVIDTRVETVLFFHFSKRIDLIKAVLINAKDINEYYDKLFYLYPKLKAWLPSIPYGEKDDIALIRLMNHQEYYSDSIKWIRNNDYSYSLQIDENTIVHIDEIRFIHIEVTLDTYQTIELLNQEGDSLGVSACLNILEIARIHMINYQKRRLQKEIEQQNNNDIYIPKKNR